MNGNLHVSALWRYPVKSLRGLAAERLPLGPRGPELDRQWMLVDRAGQFLTQRQHPRMALVEVGLGAEGLSLDAPGMPTLTVPYAGGGEPLDVQVWNDRCASERVGPEADAWLGEFLGLDCRLVRFPDRAVRQVDTRYARPGDQVGFADGFPLLLIGQASLDGLNARLQEPVDMRRFRPNLVVSGGGAHAEDGWRRLRIGELEFEVAKPCSRCPIPGIDPDTAERSPEVLKVLAQYRRGEDNKVYFGQNLLHRGSGELRIGQAVEVLA
jgi:hypothetical protein